MNPLFVIAIVVIVVIIVMILINSSSSSTRQLPVANIDIVDFNFNPANISLNRGTTVIWANRGHVPHTVTSTTNLFDSGILMPGGQFSFTFANPGIYPYFCKLHPTMRGQIEIK